jgi:hypothetical protein
MQQFGSGATRNDDGNKNDYRGFVSPIALVAYGDYMREHRTQADGSVRDSDNWKMGIPRQKYLSSIKRHENDVHLIMEGHVAINPDTGEEVSLKEALSALFFNVQGLLHEVCLDRDTCIKQPEEEPVVETKWQHKHGALWLDCGGVTRGLPAGYKDYCATTQGAAKVIGPREPGRFRLVSTNVRSGVAA